MTLKTTEKTGHLVSIKEVITNDELMIISAIDDVNNGGLLKYDDNPMKTVGLQEFYNDRNMRIITKDYDFGDPAINKKIYKEEKEFIKNNKFNYQKVEDFFKTNIL